MTRSAQPKKISCRNLTLDLRAPNIMGILNVTPDSFSDGGQYLSEKKALNRIEQMISEGADIIDVGGESTRPGSDPVDAEEEINRTIPVLSSAIKKFPDTVFSIDTTKFEVAKRALDAGAHIINDVSGLEKEPRFSDLCAETGVAYICMHSQGEPKTMQKNPQYEDVIGDILAYFKQKLPELKQGGVENVIIDPGIGFGKKIDHNVKIIASLDEFSTLGYPVMVGASRKSMISNLLGGRETDGRLAGTLAVHYHCMIHGASIIRVHDVQEAKDSADIFKAVSAAKS